MNYSLFGANLNLDSALLSLTGDLCRHPPHLTVEACLYLKGAHKCYAYIIKILLLWSSDRCL